MCFIQWNSQSSILYIERQKLNCVAFEFCMLFCMGMKYVFQIREELQIEGVSVKVIKSGNV